MGCVTPRNLTQPTPRTDGRDRAEPLPLSPFMVKVHLCRPLPSPRARCSLTVRLFHFLTAWMEAAPESMASFADPFWETEAFWKCCVLCVLLPSEAGYDLADLEVANELLHEVGHLHIPLWSLGRAGPVVVPVKIGPGKFHRSLLLAATLHFAMQALYTLFSLICIV